MGSQKRNGAAAVIKALVSSPEYFDEFLCEYSDLERPALTFQLTQ